MQSGRSAKPSRKAEIAAVALGTQALAGAGRGLREESKTVLVRYNSGEGRIKVHSGKGRLEERLLRGLPMGVVRD